MERIRIPIQNTRHKHNGALPLPIAIGHDKDQKKQKRGGRRGAGRTKPHTHTTQQTPLRSNTRVALALRCGYLEVYSTHFLTSLTPGTRPRPSKGRGPKGGGARNYCSASSEVHSVRLSRSNCMMRVESLYDSSSSVSSSAIALSKA